ncbi:MAG: SMP-30/gluconolactonase/LRE family protein, partial [Saprospiraceae bacterium]|nr:SMP-30/gluconolactonase/LRE family protein [Saprospiraceae bacterium]
MKNITNLFLLATISLIGACQSNSESAPANSTPTESHSDFRVQILHPDGEKVISPQAQIEVIAEGHEWTEGPLYVPDGDYLLYSDIPRNAIYKWTEAEGSHLFLQPAGSTGLIEREGQPGSNGLLLNAEGRLVLCQHGDRRVAIGEKPSDNIKPEYETLADKYQEAQLNSPNDGDFHSNGDLYFTDPPYGLDKNMEDPAKELDFQGVYRLKPDGQIDLISKDLKYPNGIALSKDEKKLYVANSGKERLYWMV